MLVRVDVQVLPTDRAEPCAVGSAENLLGELERDRVACPGRDVQVVVGDVVGAKLVRLWSVGIVELACGGTALDLGERKTPHARARKTNLDLHFEHGCTGGLGDPEIDGQKRRSRLVTLAAENEWLELHVEPLRSHLTWSEAEPAKIDLRHTQSVPPWIGNPWCESKRCGREAAAAKSVCASGLPCADYYLGDFERGAARGREASAFRDVARPESAQADSGLAPVGSPYELKRSYSSGSIGSGPMPATTVS